MTLHVLSDSTGNLARHVLSAIFTQFPPDTFLIRPHMFLNRPEKLEQALAKLAAAPGPVVHAVVSPAHKALIADRAAAMGVPSFDLTGGLVEFLTGLTGVTPSSDVGKLHHTNHAYHQRIRAIDFTLDHDDGLGLDTVHEADIVLTGVSRTSKTPTSIMLAQQGFKVANVSLARQVEPPPQLLSLPREKVVGLLIDPRQLAEIRTRRQQAWRMDNTSYNEADSVAEEVAWSRRLFTRQGWATVDITDRAVEETAARIVEITGLTAQVL